MAIYAQFITIGGSLSGTARYGQMQIACFDAVTNLPANGDNCVVGYTQNINGTITSGTVTIPGLSVPIYTGKLSDTSPVFATTFTIESFAVGGGIPVDPATDDLTIINVLTTPESAIGANDGTITINATSSFPAIEYSLDNSTWQLSNVFTGQISGAGIAYAKDANSVLVSKPYTVGLLGNILVSDPTVDLGNGNLSRWNAAFNNIWFKYQRKDFQITAIVQGTDSTQIVVSVNADVSETKVRTQITSVIPGAENITSPGDFVYIKTEFYNGSFEALASSTGQLTLNCPYTVNDTVGYININSIRAKYNIQTIATYVDPITGVFVSITSFNTPFPDGHCDVDMSSLLKSLLRAVDLSNYTLINYRDMQLSASYTIQYFETWTGHTPQIATVTRPYYILYSARQLGQLGGGNTQQFVPYTLGFQPALWLTDFAMPCYTSPFPFDLAFIFSEYMVGLAPFYIITLLDINMQPLTDQEVINASLLNEDGTFLLNQDGSKFIIASQSLSATEIVEHVGLNRLLINFEPPSLCYYFTVQLFYTNTPVSGSPTTYPLTISQIVRVNTDTTDRQVYLRWLGLTGSWQYYTFAYNQTITLEVTNPIMIKNFVTNWASQDTIADVISKNASKKMQVYGENVSVDDINGLEALKFSPKVQIYTGSGPKWQTVIVDAATFTEYETRIEAYNFSVVFALPEINIQTQ